MTTFMLNLSWKNYRRNFRNFLSSLTPQTVILGLTNEANNIHNLLNYILLVFKYYLYKSREKHILTIDIFINNLVEIKKKEEPISLVSKHTIKNGALQIMFLPVT